MDKEVYIFPRGICPEVNIIARLESELVYNGSAFHCFNHNTPFKEWRLYRKMKQTFFFSCVKCESFFFFCKIHLIYLMTLVIVSKHSVKLLTEIERERDREIEREGCIYRVFKNLISFEMY